jgi:hypothetical protein
MPGKVAVLIFSVLFAVLAAEPARAGEGKPRIQPVAPPARIPDPVDTTPHPSGTPVTTSAIPPAVRRAVVADAAQRFRVAANGVVLAQAERVTWPDSSLGCPEPGHVYGQALVAGFRVVAKTVEGELLYHTDTRGTVLNCAQALRDATR